MRQRCVCSRVLGCHEFTRCTFNIATRPCSHVLHKEWTRHGDQQTIEQSVRSPYRQKVTREMSNRSLIDDTHVSNVFLRRCNRLYRRRRPRVWRCRCERPALLNSRRERLQSLNLARACLKMIGVAITECIRGVRFSRKIVRCVTWRDAALTIFQG